MEKADAEPEGAEREELLHDARKAAERARYAAESVSRVFGKAATAFARAMEDVQEARGEHQDSVLTRARLRDLALRTSSTGAPSSTGACTPSRRREHSSRSSTSTTHGRPRPASPCTAGCADRPGAVRNRAGVARSAVGIHPGKAPSGSRR
jgi:CHAD domain-containing protein